MPNKVETIATNRRIHGVQGAILAFKNADMQRVYESGLVASVSLYARNNDGNQFIYARFSGRPVFVKEENDLSLSYLPPPKINRQGEPGFPLVCLTNKVIPADIELHLEDITQEEYIPTINALSTLYHSGYKSHNPEHLSTAWLYIGEKGNPKKAPLMYMAPEGLDITAATLPTGFQALSDHNLKQLMRLGE